MPALKIALLIAVSTSTLAQAAPLKRVLFFSKASSWEQKIVHRDGNQLSYIETAVQKLGRNNRIEFTFSKDGTIFTPENIAKFDAFFFFSSGDLTYEERTGRGDNYPLMTLEGKKIFLDAVRDGKGFIGCNTANYTFTQAVSPGETNDPVNAWRYTRMIGSGYMGHNEVQPGYFNYLDRNFPGMETVPKDYHPVDQWYAFNRLMPDIHVIMALDTAKLKGNLYERPPFPVAWARMEGKGRVFYTTMGHTREIWEEPVFLRMLLGGIQWATGIAAAGVTPDIGKVTPRAGEIPPGASKFIAENPPRVNPHFPNFSVWLDREYRVGPSKRILVFSKSSGYEHAIAYRDTAWPSPLEKELLDFGERNQIDFVFSKDGTIFSTEALTRFDAFLFYTSGDLTDPSRNGPGDNYPVMTAEGKSRLLQAIHGGTGFLGVHSALDTFPAADPYSRMLGAASNGPGVPRTERLIRLDQRFPGMQNVPASFTASEEWYAGSQLMPDLHVIVSRSKAPAVWARMEGKGRVYYTGLGHSGEAWKSPAFQQMLLGAIRWTTGMVDADVAPNSGAFPARH